MKPRIGLTMGDPAGIGPEVILKTLCNPQIIRRADVCVIGHEETFFEYSKKLGISPIFRELEKPGEWPWRKVPFLVSCAGEEKIEVTAPGSPSAAGGRLSFLAVKMALELTREGHLDGFVTAPISKKSWNMAGYDFTGHTDFLAGETGSDAVMMMVGGRLRASLVTVHVSLREAIESLNAENIVKTIRITHDALKNFFGLSGPRLAVAGLNPHAGETGLLGSEEGDLIEPAVRMAGKMGFQVQGPIPADVAFRLAALGKFDAVVSMYHDQGLIPVKIFAFDEAVNVTIGIPVVRTSPAHGTAFDIAGKGIARQEGLGAAIAQAADIVRRRRSNRS